MNAKIYEVKSGAASNYRPLLSPDGQYFYWNGAKFASNEPGDEVYVVNRHSGEALYTVIGEKGINATYDSVRNKSHFNHNNNSYEPDGEWTDFVRFDIRQRVTIPQGWNWSKQLGQSETYDLWKKGITEIENRKTKVADLQAIFIDGVAAASLLSIMSNLEGLSFKGYEIPDIEKLLERPDIKAVMTSEAFWHEKPRVLFQELLAFSMPASFYDKVLEDFTQRDGVKFHEYIAAAYDEGTHEHAFCLMCGRLIAYMDSNAANKNSWNEYDDKRVYARAGIRMGIWFRNLIRFKRSNNNFAEVAIGVRNALEYANNPMQGIPIISEEHKSLIAEHILRKPYQHQDFLVSLKDYFQQYNIAITNSENASKVWAMILYADQVKPIWKDSIGGLVAIDPNTDGWMEDAINDSKDANGVVLWWSKMPSGTDATINKLMAKIQKDKSFELFYIVDGLVRYRAEVIDIATAANYDSKNWHEIEGLSWVKPNFSDYSDDRHQAAIVFQVQHFEKLVEPFSVDAFSWYNGFTAPTRNNLQPFEEYNLEKDASQPGALQAQESISFKTTIDFEKDEYASILAAIQTKPFILLAGISGTGKSRLVRSLAYHTCWRKELQHENRPGNFELIMVLPNWHDSSELIGYESRMSGKLLYKVTPFLRFLVKARQYADVPFFLCLDEMNLAPVEQYFAEFLSIIETRRFKQDAMVSDPFIPANLIKAYTEAMGQDLWLQLGIDQDIQLQQDLLANGIQLPANLVVMGTVNMDETTHSFSRKVLDRAMTIEMNEVDLMRGLETLDTDLVYPDEYYHYDLVLGKMQGGHDAYNALGEEGKVVIDQLKKINEKLDATPFKLAYRVRDEMLTYCYHCSKAVEKAKDWLQYRMDEFLLMKLLTRIEGDDRRCKQPLTDLQSLFPANFKRCQNKLKQMIDRLESDNYTSFWS